MSAYLIAALYKFVDLPDYQDMQAPLQACCDANQVKGTLLLAQEGINGTIAGPEAGLRAVLAYLRSDGRLHSLEHKESWSERPPFVRMKVRLKKEIVTMGVPGVNPNQMAGSYVKPEDWNALIGREDVVLVDTRNDYEVDIGTFKGAVNPQVETFSDLPQWVAEQEQAGGVLYRADGRKPAVAMFCTGGIRCEKSTALMRMLGYDEVYHLQGGILKYLENVPTAESQWDGECFVFDERVSVGHGLQAGDYELCRACGHPVSAEDRSSPHYVKGVSCHRCVDSTTPEQKERFAQRHRQVLLAQQKGIAHIGSLVAASEQPQTPDTSAKP
jgi:UPF0176 protein